MTETLDEVRSYLKMIGRVPMLKATEEIELGKQVKRMRNCREIQEQLSSEKSRVTKEEWAGHLGITRTELDQILKRGEKAKEKMVNANLRLVVAVAKKYQGQGLELLDLVQEGNLGLIRAVEKFEVDKGYKFSTYAYHWIRQGITRAIFESGRTIRLPVHIHEELRKLKKEQLAFHQEIGRNPTVVELSQRLEISTEKVRLLGELKRPIVSLDKKILKEEEDSTLLNFIADPNANLTEFLETLGNRELVEKLLPQLQPREQRVIQEYYLEIPSKSLKEIGKNMQVTRERVRQIKARAMLKLTQAISDYLEKKSEPISVEVESNSSLKSVKLKEIIKDSELLIKLKTQEEHSEPTVKLQTQVSSSEKSPKTQTKVPLLPEGIDSKPQVKPSGKAVNSKFWVNSSKQSVKNQAQVKSGTKSLKSKSLVNPSEQSVKPKTQFKRKQAEIQHQLSLISLKK